MLLVRLSHPAAHGHAWKPAHLTEMPEFQAAVARM